MKEKLQSEYAVTGPSSISIHGIRSQTISSPIPMLCQVPPFPARLLSHLPHQNSAFRPTFHQSCTLSVSCTNLYLCRVSLHLREFLSHKFLAMAMAPAMSNSRSSGLCLESLNVGLRSSPSSRLNSKQHRISVHWHGRNSQMLVVSASLKLSRRVAVMSFMAAPSVLTLAPLVSRALELPSFKDEFDQEEDSLIELFSNATRSVVSVQNVQTLGTKVVGQPVSEGEEVKVEGIGSGFIWDKFGHVVTNYHVIARLAMDSSGRQKAQVSVLGRDGTITVHDASLIGIDSSHDLAVLKIDAPAERLTPIPVGTSEDIRVGQNCFAIGNPYGFQHTLTTGVVSGLGREIPSPAGVPIPGAIQTDAAINSGNSGGPLLDSFGRIIGVNTATFTRAGSGMSSGVNFAIPINTVRMLVPRLIVYGTVTPTQSPPVIPSKSLAKRYST